MKMYKICLFCKKRFTKNNISRHIKLHEWCSKCNAIVWKTKHNHSTATSTLGFTQPLQLNIKYFKDTGSFRCIRTVDVLAGEIFKMLNSNHERTEIDYDLFVLYFDVALFFQDINPQDQTSREKLLCHSFVKVRDLLHR